MGAARWDPVEEESTGWFHVALTVALCISEGDGFKEMRKGGDSGLKFKFATRRKGWIWVVLHTCVRTCWVV